MAENQVYFVHAFRHDRTFKQDFIATSKSEANELMKDHLASKLQHPIDWAEWQFSVNTTEEEKTLRALDENRPL
jgi:hypothetical protein